ncbi:MAG: sodium:solute symporter [Candidatus Hydrothermarchaeota archaeon]
MNYNLLILMTFIAITLFLGLRRKSIDIQQMLIAEKKLGTFDTVINIFATSIGPHAIVGTIGMIWVIGFAEGAAELAAITGLLIFAFILIRPVRENSEFSPPDMWYNRYGLGITLFIHFIYFFVLLISFAGIIKAGAWTVGSLTGLGFLESCLLTVLPIMLYAIFGGLRSVVITDVFQAIFVFLALAIPAFFALTMIIKGKIIGVPHELYSMKFEGDPSIAGLGVFSRLLPWYLVILLNYIKPSSVLGYRSISAESEEVAKKSMFYTLPLWIFYMICVFLIGYACKGLFPNWQDLGNDRDNAYMFFVSVLPYSQFLKPFLLLCLFAAIVSTIDTQIINLTAAYTRNVYIVFFEKVFNLEERFRLKASRIIAFIFGLTFLFAVPIVPKIESIWLLDIFIRSVTAVVIVPPYFCAYFLPKKFANKYGCWIGVILGILGVFAVEYYKYKNHVRFILGLVDTWWYVIICILVTILIISFSRVASSLRKIE